MRFDLVHDRPLLVTLTGASPRIRRHRSSTFSADGLQRVFAVNDGFEDSQASAECSATIWMELSVDQDDDATSLVWIVVAGD